MKGLWQTLFKPAQTDYDDVWDSHFNTTDDLANQSEAETGTENTKVMTALRVLQSIVYQMASYSFSALNTTSKNIVGAINELFASIGIIDTPQPWSSTIQFDGNYGSFSTNTHTQSGAISYAINWTGAVFGAVTSRVEISDGNTFTFPSGNDGIDTSGATGTKTGSIFTPVAGKRYMVTFMCTDVSNQKYKAFIKDDETTAQLNAPVLNSATLDSGKDIDLVYTDTNTYPPEVQIEIEYDTVNTFDSGSEASVFALKDSTGYKVTLPYYNTLYYFRVRAIGDGENTETSPWSNIESETTGVGSIIVQDDFTGTTTDTGKWTKVDPADQGTISQNDQAVGTFTGQLASVRSNYLESLYDDTGESLVVVQSTLSNVQSAVSSGHWIRGLWDDNSSTDEILILGTTANPSLARLWIKQGGVLQYDLDTAISINNPWKILKDGNNISFYYWSGSAWVQAGTTQSITFSVVLKPFLSLAFGNNGDVVYIDDFYFTNYNYATSTP